VCFGESDALGIVSILTTPQLSVQRLRFCLWGQLVGLIPIPSSGLHLCYNESLDLPDVRPHIERILHNIKSLLDDASLVDEKYGPKAVAIQESLSNSRGLDIFKVSFERFKNRIRRHQQDASPWQVTRWAVHDAKKFEDLIDRLEKFVNGLEAITKSLGPISELHKKLQEEVEEISDTRSLKLLRDASSSHRSTVHSLSDSSSRRLIKTVAESVLEQQTLESGASGPGTTFITAGTGRVTMNVSLGSDRIVIPGAWPESLTTRSIHSKAHPFDEVKPFGNHKQNSLLAANEKAKDMNRSINFPTVELQDAVPGQQAGAPASLKSLDLPQNQRLVRDLLEKSRPQKPLSFAAGDANYGKTLATFKEDDEKSWLGHSGNLLIHAESGSSAAKRMFLELRDIRTSKVPFISAAPLGDSLDKVLASIEGPPETPYEGGIFWITVRLSRDPSSPPLMRFHTKIYHPNISPQGHICADYKQRWNSSLIDSSMNSWYHRKKGDPIWSLGALLTALCGLLAAPDVDDPLVPEIAQKYLEEYDEYWQAAILYTKRYAMSQRPEEPTLLFLDDFKEIGAEHAPYSPTSKPKWADTASIQPSLHSQYNEPAPAHWRDSASQTPDPETPVWRYWIDPDEFRSSSPPWSDEPNSRSDPPLRSKRSFGRGSVIR
jgi:ubiquitin-protein ligase